MKLMTKFALGVFACALLISGLTAMSKLAYAAVATIVRDQDNPARHPFVTSCSSEAGINFECSTPPIPAGQQVVIETVSFNGFNVPAGVSVFFPALSTTAAGARQFYALDPASVISGVFQQVKSLRLYADPGTVITCDGSPDAGSLFGAEAGCSISGYFVTLP
ncbi:MAG TPA: hypothetical protein VE935_13670 [Burkholderiales bacterium]|jgi:hypothetical protein|nr:hypothetical protein [Burkholderiales bacterium]